MLFYLIHWRKDCWLNGRDCVCAKYEMWRNYACLGIYNVCYKSVYYLGNCYILVLALIAGQICVLNDGAGA